MIKALQNMKSIMIKYNLIFTVRLISENLFLIKLAKLNLICSPFTYYRQDETINLSLVMKQQLP